MKLVLADTAAGYNLSKLNNNFNLIESELQSNVLYRNNPTGEPNQMENDLDLNNYNIINVNELNGENFSNLTGNLTTVANLDAEINTVAAISTEVQTVAGDSAEIQAVNNNLTDIVSVNANEADIKAVAANEADIDTVALNITDVQNVSNNIDDVNSFAQLYLGSKASDPTMDNDGDALVDGALYFNTSANGGNGELRIYSSTAGTWDVAAFSASAANGVTYNNGTSGLAATDVQAAVDEIDSTLDTVPPEIRSGAFSPASPTLVWSGADTLVPIEELSESGNGLYLLQTGGPQYYMIYLFNNELCFGTSRAENGLAGEMSIYTCRYQLGGFSVKIENVQGTGDAPITIQAVYKV